MLFRINKETFFQFSIQSNGSHSIFLLDRRLQCFLSREKWFGHPLSKITPAYYFYLCDNKRHWQTHDWKKWAKSFFLVDMYTRYREYMYIYISLHKILKITRAFHTYTYVNMKHLHTCERERKRGRKQVKKKEVPIFHVRET